MRVKPRCSYIVVLALLLATTTGCAILVGGYKFDVTNKEKYWGGYRLGAQYETKVDLFLVEVEGWRARISATPPQAPHIHGRYEFRVPGTIEKYRSVGRTPQFSNVIGILESGTKIEIVRMKRHGAIGCGSAVDVYAEVMSGPFEGQEIGIVNLSWGTVTDDGPLLLKPNHALIVEVGDEQGRAGSPSH